MDQHDRGFTVVDLMLVVGQMSDPGSIAEVLPLGDGHFDLHILGSSCQVENGREMAGGVTHVGSEQEGQHMQVPNSIDGSVDRKMMVTNP